MNDKPWLASYDTGVPDVINIPNVTLPELLADTAKTFPNKTAAIFYNNKLSYKELDKAVTQFAAGLQALGMQPGDRVAVYLPNSPQFIIAYYGILRAGGIVVPSNIQYVPRELKHQFNDSGCKYVVALSKFYPNVREIRDQTAVEHVIVTNIKEYFPRVLNVLFTLAKEKKEGHRVDISNERGTHWFQDVLEIGEARGLEPVATSNEDTALLGYTGGTTGVPKGAELTHRNLLANVYQLRAWDTEMRPGNEVVMGALPFFHSYGMSTAMNLGLSGGHALILIPNPRDLTDVLKNVDKHKPTLFPAVPTLYTAINNYPDIDKYDLSSLRACLSGGAGLPIEVQKKFEEITGAFLVEGYGLTETAPVACATPLRGKRKVGKIGLPVPSTEVKVVDGESGAEVELGQPGELLIRGPQVMKGYWQRPEETAETIDDDGWLHTGDMGTMDEEGFFEIVDRKKDMIIASGYNIYPREIEEVLYEHPKVLEAAVAGIPDEYRGETVKAFVVLKEGESATAEDIMEFTAQRLAPYKRPRSVEFRDELPKSMVGKILRRVLVEEELKSRQPA
ncbi:MAG: long-chain fatty acid--CoA ligase [Anaerolineales bacterium]|nr:long-chain fatty acid--CoA ligase [Anaerolineales bacterium]